MTDYNSYPTILQSSQTEYVNSETMTANSNQMSNSANNNIIYNSSPLIVLNSQKQDMALLQNSMLNDGQTYVTIQTQPSNGTGDLNGSKLLNTPIIIQSSQPSQYQQSQQQQQQQATTINVQQNATQMTSLTPSQLQSLSYLMQTQMAPQFIQTTNGLIQIIPQSFLTTQQQSNQGQAHDQSQLSGLPTIGWSLGNFNTTNNNITLDSQLQPLQMNNLNLSQLIPLQQVIQSNNSFFANNTNNNVDQDQMVSTIVDLNNVNDKKSLNGSTRKPSRRKRKQTTKITNDSQMSLATSTNEVKLEAAESSIQSNILESIIQYDNKGRPFSFLCPDCPKKFTLNSRLSAHMRCHTGMRPFTCTVCGFSFTQKSYLIRHAAVHKEERPFHCEKCMKSYKHYGSLANHRKLHRKEDKDVCEGEGGVCNQVKMEPTASDNGRSSSISSLVINNNNNGCGDFVISHNGGTMAICREESDQNENMYAITSTTVPSDNDGEYLKQMAMIYPMSTIVDDGKSMNIFFQEPPSQQQLQQHEPQDVGVSYEEDYEGEEEDDDEEEEEDEEGNGEEEEICGDSDMVDLSMNDDHNHVSSGTYDALANSATITNEYHRH